MTTYNPYKFSSTHLSSDELLKYHRHLLSDEERNRIESHLKDCELCSDAMKGIAEMHDAMKIYNITHELKNRIKKRISVRRKIFTATDMLSIIMILFLLGIILLIAFYFLYFNK